MTSQTKAKDKDQFVVRLPNGMRDQIANAAKLSNRSMNAEIVARLEESFLSGVSARYKWALEQVNSASLNPLSVSKVAEAVSEETAEQLEQVFSGSAYPPFDLSDRVAAYLNVRADWLKHGDGHPYDVETLYSYGAGLADRFIEQQPEKIAFIRSLSREGNVAIVLLYEGLRCQVFKSTLNLSDVVGGSGEYDQISFSNTCRSLFWPRSKTNVAGYLLNPEQFIQLIHGDLNPLLAIKQARLSHWPSDWWDPSSFEKTGDNGYWPGYTELCQRVYRNLEFIAELRLERDKIVQG